MRFCFRPMLSAGALTLVAALAIGCGGSPRLYRDAMQVAMEHDDAAGTKRYLEEHPEFAKEKDANGVGPLWTPAKRGNLEIVKLLVERGADVNDRNKSGWTPLMLAASEGHEPVVSYLLSKGADPKAVDQKGTSALTIAALHGHAAVVGVLLKAGAPADDRSGRAMPPLLAAITSGNLDPVKLIVESGADIRSETPNAKGGKFMAPLALARKKGHKPIEEYLVSKGAE